MYIYIYNRMRVVIITIILLYNQCSRWCRVVPYMRRRRWPRTGLWLRVCFSIFFNARVYSWLAFGLWLLAAPASGLKLEPKSLICVPFAAFWSNHLQFACPLCFWHWAFGFWLLASLGSWLLVWLFDLGFSWLLAFGRAAAECMCSIVVCK